MKQTYLLQQRLIQRLLVLLLPVLLAGNSWAQSQRYTIKGRGVFHINPGHTPVFEILVEAGDLILFRWRPHLPAKHAAIAVAADRFIHAYQGHAVLESALVPQWRARIAGVFRFPEIASAGPGGMT